MMILPCAFWPLAEHAEFGQNCFDASIGSVSVCIYDSMPIDACLFKPSFPFHRIVGSYLPFNRHCFCFRSSCPFSPLSRRYRSAHVLIAEAQELKKQMNRKRTRLEDNVYDNA